MPDLTELINDFEKGDEVLATAEEDLTNHFKDLKLRGQDTAADGKIGLEKALRIVLAKSTPD